MLQPSTWATHCTQCGWVTRFHLFWALCEQWMGSHCMEDEDQGVCVAALHLGHTLHTVRPGDQVSSILGAV